MEQELPAFRARNGHGVSLLAALLSRITGRRKVGKVGWIEREATEATSDSFGMKVHQQAGGHAS